MIKIHLNVPPEYRSAARYAMEELAIRMGVPVRFSAETDSVDLIYGPPVRTQAPGAAVPCVHIPFDPRSYEAVTICEALQDEAGRFLWSAGPRLAGELPDLVGGTWRLLNYLDESQVPESARDRRGIFLNAALPPGRRAMEAEPLVENHADALFERLLQLKPGLAAARLPRWPDGAAFAVAVTHDVDAAHLGAPLELGNNFGKALRRRSRAHWEQAILGLQYLGRKAKNPVWAFPTWRAWEEERQVRSTFFLYHRPGGVAREWDDCRSAVAGRGADWVGLRQMARDGWEFGIHPSIRVRFTPGAFADSRAWLEGRLEQPVRGLRHHFWALDWRRPFITHRQHQEAGFQYDSSIAWRDSPGFRAGTSLPYRPCDPDTGVPIPFTVIPCVIQDRNVLYAGVGKGRTESDDALRSGIPALHRVRASRGLLTLNWHQETAWDRNVYRGFLPVLGGLLDLCRRESTCWVTTPGQIRVHWQALRERIIPTAEDAA